MPPQDKLLLQGQQYLHFKVIDPHLTISSRFCSGNANDQ